MRTRRKVIAAGTAAFTAVAAAIGGAGAADVTLTGELSTSIGWNVAEEEVTEAETSFNLTAEYDLGLDGKIHVDLDGAVPHNFLLDDEGNGSDKGATLDLGEAYVDVYFPTTDVRAGRQVVSWGTADGFNPTNVVNPMGALSPTDMELKGEPVPAVTASYYLPSGDSLTGVAVLDFVPSDAWEAPLNAMAEGMIAEGMLVPGADPADPARPERSERFELALRGSAFIGGHNVYASYFNGWDDNPVAWVEFDPTSPPATHPIPTGIGTEYRKVQKFGLATAGTLGGSAVWTELGYTVPEELDELNAAAALSSPLSPNDPYVEAVVGGDYTFDGGVTTSVQVIYNGAGSMLSPYAEPGQPVESETYGMGTLRYAPNADNEWELVAIVNASDGSGVVVPRYTHDVTQLVSLSISAPQAFGGDNSDFGAAADAIEVVTVGIDVRF